MKDVKMNSLTDQMFEGMKILFNSMKKTPGIYHQDLNLSGQKDALIKNNVIERLYVMNKDKMLVRISFLG